MARSTCVIYDPDEIYAKRLMAAINDNNEVPFSAQVFTDKDELEEYLKNATPEVLMINEEIYEYNLDDKSAGKVVVLCENEINTQHDFEKENVLVVCKYQSITDLINLVVPHKIKRKLNVGTKIIGVMGFNNSERTVLAISAAKAFAKKGHTLFISLEEFAGLGVILGNRGTKTLSDALYCFKQNKMQFHKRIEECISTVEGVDYIPPVICAEDISYIGVEDLVNFIQSIGRELGYCYIVVDIGNGIKSPWNLYGTCDRLFMPKSHNYFDKAREFSMVEYMNETGMERLLDEIMEVPVDIYEDCMDERIFRRIEYSKTYKNTKEVIDVC